MSTPSESSAAQRPLSESPADAQRAAELLRTSNALIHLSPADADCVVGYMRLVHFPPGALLFREGDDTRLGYMLLLMEGEVSVDSAPATRQEIVPFSVLGPGSVIGEMAVLDGSPRSATCTAISAVQAAGLSSKGLELLIEQHPQVAAKLLLALGTRIADRLRAMGEQLQIYAELADKLQTEVDRLRGGHSP